MLSSLLCLNLVLPYLVEFTEQGEKLSGQGGKELLNSHGIVTYTTAEF